jgi:hypothetical protein
MFDPLAILVFAITIIFGLLLIWKSVKFFIINSVVGLSHNFPNQPLGWGRHRLQLASDPDLRHQGVLGALMVIVLAFSGISL